MPSKQQIDLYQDQIIKHIQTINRQDHLNEIAETWLRERPPYNRETYQQAFIEWGQGLPTALDVEFVTDNVMATLRSWCENAGLNFEREYLSDMPMHDYLSAIYHVLYNTGYMQKQIEQYENKQPENRKTQ